MGETPHRTYLTQDIVQGQVKSNYRNKLKLRREIRVGKKLGHALTEVQPNSSAHMFASDPAETNAFRRVPVPTIDHEHNNNRRANLKVQSENSPPSTRRRQSQRKLEKDEDLVDSKAGIRLQNESLEGDDGVDDEDNDGNADFHDFDDDVSIASQREVKFWEGDPSQLQVDNFDDSEDDPDVEDRNPGGKEGADADTFGADESDPDYEADDNDDDEDWGTQSDKSRKSSRPTSKRTETSIENTAKSKPVPKSKSPNLTFVLPDVILRKDGRVFMSDIEIIKNPPGAYIRRPDSVSFTCGACNKITLTSWQIRNHICGHHLGMFKCPTCGKQFTDRKALQQHVKQNHSDGGGNIPCPICGRPIFGTTSHVRYHRWSHLSEEEKKDPKFRNYCPPHKRDPNRIKNNFGLQSFICSYCSKSFSSTSALQKHELIHTDDAPSFQCQYCGKIFNKKKSLHAHNQACSKKSLGIDSSERFPCPKCTVTFKSRAGRHRHVRREHDNVSNVSHPKSKSHKRICSEGPGSKVLTEDGSVRDPNHPNHPQPCSSSSTGYDGAVIMEPDPESTSVDDSSSNYADASSREDGRVPASSVMAPAFGFNVFGNYSS